MLKDAIELIQTVIADLQAPLAAATVAYLHAGNLAPNGIPLLLQIPLTRLTRGLMNDAKGGTGERHGITVAESSQLNRLGNKSH